MEGRQLSPIFCCLLVAILSTSCFSQTWRPQGRFGKRFSPAEVAYDGELTHGQAPGSLRLQDIPVELFVSEKEMERSRTKPRLCSVSGLPGYPVCDFFRTSRREAEFLSKVLDL